jgi:hypothetical protein
MPRIPLANIPNTPGPGPAPALVQGGGFRVNMAGAANGLMQREQNPAPYVAAAGMDALADGVADVGGVFSQLSAEMAHSKNVADIARAEKVMTEAKIAHAQEIQTLPESEWNKVWETKYRPQVEKDIAGIGLSTWSRDRVAPMVTHFDSRVMTETAYAAHKQTLQRDEQAILNGQQRMMQDGDYVGAMEQTALLVESGHATPEQGEKINLSIQDDQKNAFIETKMDADPDGLIADIEGGKIVVPEARKGKIINAANISKRRQVAESNDYLDQQILTQQMTDPEEIRQWGESRGLSERDIQSHVISATKVFETTPAGRARVMEAINTANLDMANLNPNDDEDLSNKMALKEYIRSNVPVGPKDDLLQKVDKIYRDKSVNVTLNDIKSALFSANRDNASNGFYGDSKSKDQKVRAKIADTERVKQEAIIKYLQENPNATSQDAHKWFFGEVHGNVIDAVNNGLYQNNESQGWVSWTSTLPTRMLAGAMSAGREKKKSIEELSAEVDSQVKMPQ